MAELWNGISQYAMGASGAHLRFNILMLCAVKWGTMVASHCFSGLANLPAVGASR